MRFFLVGREVGSSFSMRFFLVGRGVGSSFSIHEEISRCWGEDVIAILSWEEWWDFELKKDESNPQIALLPLHPDVRAKFNNTEAWEYARSMDGKPYGYHNIH